MEVGRVLSLTEYAPAIIVPEYTWATLQIDEAVEILESKGIISHRAESGVHLIESAGYVGEFILPGRAIRILPRYPRLYEDLRGWISRSASKLVNLIRGIKISKDTRYIDPAIAFVRSLESAIDMGLPMIYKRQRINTSTPKGRLLVSETVKNYFIKGIFHYAACSITAKTVLPELMGVVREAGIVAGRSSALSRRDLFNLDLMLSLFSDDMPVPTEAAIHIAESLLIQYSENGPAVELLRAVIALLNQEALLVPFHQPALGGIAHFHKMDRLWELAVLAALAEIQHSYGLYPAFHPFAGKGKLLFPAGGPEIDPDIIVFDDKCIYAVVDAKYSLANRAPSGDIYQISCYVESLSAKSGLLVYLTDGGSWMRRIGDNRDGAGIFEAGIPITSVVSSLMDSVKAYYGDLNRAQKSPG